MIEMNDIEKRYPDLVSKLHEKYKERKKKLQTKEYLEYKKELVAMLQSLPKITLE